MQACAHLGRLLPILCAVLASAACTVDPPVSSQVRLQFDAGGERVRITTTTNLKRDIDAGATRPRLVAAREAILAGRDEWSNRFAAIETETKRLTLDEQMGVLRRAEIVATADYEQLHRFFADTPLSLQLTQGEGWTELTIWGRSASRATRQQREEVERMLDLWSADGARYLAAVGRLYEYLEQRPERAEPLFTSLLAGDEQPMDDDAEETLLREIRASIQQIVERIEAARDNAFSIDEQFDLVFNPFPAPMTIQTSGPVVEAQNFKRVAEDTVEVPRAGITDALQALEGRWVSPDPLAFVVRSMNDLDTPDARTIAAIPRKRTPGVKAADIEAAFTQVLQHPSVYRMRWTKRAD